MRYLEMATKEGGIVRLEVTGDLSGQQADIVKTSTAAVTQEIRSSLEEVVNIVETITDAFAERVQLLLPTVGEVAIEFGLKVDASAGILVSKAGAEASFRVTVKWKDVGSKGNVKAS